MNTKEFKSILAAIKSGKYKVEIKESNLITQYEKYDGTPFLRVSQENSRTDSHFGYCAVTVEKHTFVCNFADGTWYENEKKIEDKELITILCSAPKVISGTSTDSFSMCELYAQLHQLPIDIDFCMENEDSCLKDINDLGGSNIEVEINYTLDIDNENENMTSIEISDGDLFDVYKFLKQRNLLPKDSDCFNLTDKMLKAEFPDLFEEIIELLKEQDENDPNILNFSIPLSRDIFEVCLYGDINH